LRIGDTVARVGGDEFVVLQVGIRREDEARLLAHRIVRTPCTAALGRVWLNLLRCSVEDSEAAPIIGRDTRDL